MDPFEPVPGQIPWFGQRTKYEFADGVLANCIVLNPIGHGNDWAVGAAVQTPLGAYVYGSWKYDLSRGIVIYVPCGPPH